MHRRDFIGSGSAFLALSLMASAPASAKVPPGEPVKPSRNDRPVLNIRDLAIGEGQPKVIVPCTADSESEALDFVAKTADNKDFHILELRLDMLDNVSDAQAMATLSQQISSRLRDKLLLLTFRTKAEGGKKAISDRDYAALYHSLLQKGQFDLLDIEMYRDSRLTTPLIAQAHEQGRHVVLSSHELQSTPSAAEIVSRLREQQERGADILKMAAMPKSPADVLTLLNATLEMHENYARRPLLTMSMGDTGVLSRMSGELTGSALTFGMIGNASASGQVAAKELNNVLSVVHKGMAS